MLGISLGWGGGGGGFGLGTPICDPAVTGTCCCHVAVLFLGVDIIFFCSVTYRIVLAKLMK